MILNFDFLGCFISILMILNNVIGLIGWVIVRILLAKVFIEHIIITDQKNRFDFALLCPITTPEIIIILLQKIKLSFLFKQIITNFFI